MTSIRMPNLRAQQGFTVVELMIAGVLGLLLLNGVIQLFLGSNRTFSLQHEMATLQEDGRFAMVFLEEQLHDAGWMPDALQAAIAAIDVNTSADVTDPLAGDTLVVKRRSRGATDRDCNGNFVTTTDVVNSFYLDKAKKQLMCQGNVGSAAQPLISNVESFQVMYGIETDTVCPDGAVNRYVTLPGVAGAYSDKVMSVRVAILLASEKEVLDKAPAVVPINILDLVYVPPEDRKVRKLFQQTVFLPNSTYQIFTNALKFQSCPNV